MNHPRDLRDYHVDGTTLVPTQIPAHDLGGRGSCRAVTENAGCHTPDVLPQYGGDGRMTGAVSEMSASSVDYDAPTTAGSSSSINSATEGCRTNQRE